MRGCFLKLDSTLLFGNNRQLVECSYFILHFFSLVTFLVYSFKDLVVALKGAHLA